MAELFAWLFQDNVNRESDPNVTQYSPSPSMYSTRAEPREPSYCFCNCVTCCYFTLAVFLFTTGSAITVLTLGGQVGGFIIGLGHLWVIGPIFICSGLMIAVKTILYARRQTIVAILTRRELNCPPEDMPSPRDPASYILPPSYDSIAGECSTQTGSHLLPPTMAYNIPQQPNHPPPCYEEALLGSSLEPIHYQGIKGYSLSKPDNLNNYEYEDDSVNNCKRNERRD